MPVLDRRFITALPHPIIIRIITVLPRLLNFLPPQLNSLIIFRALIFLLIVVLVIVFTINLTHWLPRMKFLIITMIIITIIIAILSPILSTKIHLPTHYLPIELLPPPLFLCLFLLHLHLLSLLLHHQLPRVPVPPHLWVYDPNQVIISNCIILPH